MTTNELCDAVLPLLCTTLASELATGTLYRHENGYEDHIRQNVYKFMVEKLGFPDEASAREKHAELFAHTNQTLKALRTVGGYTFDLEEYFSFTRAGCEAFLKPDEEVNRLLDALKAKYELVILTNADEVSAAHGLQVLGLAKYFKQVFGSRFMGELCKPDHAAFEKVLLTVGAKPEECMFFDDSLRNIKGAKELGISTVYVVNQTPREKWDRPEVLASADYVIPFPTYDEVHRAIPALLDSPDLPN